MPAPIAYRYDAAQAAIVPVRANTSYHYPYPARGVGRVVRYQDGSVSRVSGDGSVYGLSGLGAGTAQSIAVSGTQIAGGTLSTVAASTGSLWGMASSVAIPVIGAAVAAITIGLTALFSRKGPKQKLATTKIVEEAEPKLQANLAAYLSGPRTLSSQAQALANFDAVFLWIEQNCETESMGNPGKACVADRTEGACHYKTSPGGWSADGSTYTPPGANNSGSTCWNWYVGYRDPIANDPAVVPDPEIDASGNLVQVTQNPVTGQLEKTVIAKASTSGNLVSELFSGTGSGGNSLLLVAGAAALILIATTMGGSNNR